MAIIPIQEPYVKVSERIREYPTLLNIDGTANIGGVIVAPTGPRLAYVSGPQDFLDKYTVDGNVPRNADITFLNAYYMSFSAGLVIARSMNTTAVDGLFFTKESRTISEMLVNISDETCWCVVIDSKCYFGGSTTSFTGFRSMIATRIDDPAYSSMSEAYDSVYDAICDIDSTSAFYCKDLSEMAKLLDASYNATSGKLSKVNGGLVTPSIAVGFEYTTATQETKDVLVGNKITYKDGVALNLQQDIKLEAASNYAFVIGTMAYYHGAVDKSKYSDYSLIQIESLDDLANSINGMAGMSAEVLTGADGEYVRVYASEGNAFEAVTVESASDLYVGITKFVVTEPTVTDMSAMIFAVYVDTPQDADIYSIQFDPYEGDTFLMTLSDGNKSETHIASLNMDAVDQSGSNVFIENLNSLGLGYTFVTNPTADVVTPSVTSIYKFGDSGLDLSACGSITSKVNALYALEDQELYDIEYLAPFGETNLQFIKNYQLVGKNNDWFTPVDIPWNKTNTNSIKSYFLNVNNDSNVIAMGPFDKNTGLTGFMFYLAPSTIYYTKVMQNRSAMKEFAPVFDITNGVLDYSNPAYLLGKEDRTSLLNLKCPVNFVIYNQRSQVYYFNDNRTHQSTTNIVSEEQNRRCINKIKKDCKRLLGVFKGRLNTASTRADVVSSLRYYFQTVVMNQLYKPNEYEIICDESNNTVETINANKLGVTVRVRLDNAIKFVDVLVDVFPLGVDFNS